MKRGSTKYQPGQVFGHIKLLEYIRPLESRNYWNCICLLCNKEKKVFNINRITSGRIKTCGCQKKDLTTLKKGDKFGLYTLISYSHSTKGYKKYWNAVCECGTEKKVEASSLVSGKVRSCGCERYKGITEESVTRIEAKRIFKERYSDGDIDFSLFFKMSQDNCHYCGSPPSSRSHVIYNNDGTLRDKKAKENNNVYLQFPNAYFVYNGLDRKSSSGLHDVVNVVTCCSLCNKTKRNLEYEDFLNLIRSIHKNMSLYEEGWDTKQDD